MVSAVWVVVARANASTAAAATATLPAADRVAANAALLQLTAAFGNSTPLADAVGSGFFALVATDSGAPVATAPTLEQVRAVEKYFLDVYNDEWDRFLVGMIATTILGTAAYITAHCFIHRVAAVTDKFPTAEVPVGIRRA